MSAGVDYEERVRRLWAGFERAGVEGMRPFVDDDVEWRPADGPVIRGLTALAQHWRELGGRKSVVAHAWEQHGECVLVHGSMREFRDGGFVETQPSWVYFFREGRLLRAVSFASREEAVAAIEQHRRLSRRVAG
jgi:ketosteroid isomerase-like protein